jgi:hypothetical protein
MGASEMMNLITRLRILRSPPGNGQSTRRDLIEPPSHPSADTLKRCSTSPKTTHLPIQPSFNSLPTPTKGESDAQEDGANRPADEGKGKPN